MDPTDLPPDASAQGLTLRAVFFGVSALGFIAVLLTALKIRPQFARFVAVVLGIHTIAASAVAIYSGPTLPAVIYLQATVYIHFLALSSPKLKPPIYKLFISLPASFFTAACFLAIPFSILCAVGLPSFILIIPFLLSAFGIFQSFYTRKEEINLRIDGKDVGGLRRYSYVGDYPSEPLRIVQLTDTHIGPFMSVERLQKICDRAVALDPDLILLTGDYLTMESSNDVYHLREALSPLRAMKGKVFACNGNHDHEAPEIVTEAMKALGIRLLVDDQAIVETTSGTVQIIGMDFHWKNRAQCMQAICRVYPRIPNALRIILLHNPGAFRELPEGEGDLVLSGHTHGGQLGLVSLGFAPTLVRAFVDIPDHGQWARGTDRLYVHRGTCHYGFPIRLGVPAEESLLRVYWTPKKSTPAAP